MADCKDLKAYICGKRELFFPAERCGTIRFEGVTDVTVNQGSSFDPTDGVHAYDSRDNEVSFTVEPSSIDTSVAGTYTLTYRASGGDVNMKPDVCGKDALNAIGCDYGVTVVQRTVTVVETERRYELLFPYRQPNGEGLGGVYFRYSITPIDDAPVLDGSTDGVYYFEIEGTDRHLDRDSVGVAYSAAVLPVSGSYARYLAKAEEAPQGYNKAEEEYTIYLITNDGELAITIVDNHTSDLMQNLVFTPSIEQSPTPQ